MKNTRIERVIFISRDSVEHEVELDELCLSNMADELIDHGCSNGITYLLDHANCKVIPPINLLDGNESFSRSETGRLLLWLSHKQDNGEYTLEYYGIEKFNIQKISSYRENIVNNEQSIVDCSFCIQPTSKYGVIPADDNDETD